MLQRKLKAVFMRGGTSKALMFHQRDLPAARDDWAPIFLGAIGAPDPNGRQLDGMGGGVSSLSKVCVIGPPSRSDADVDYTFAQVSVKEAVVDYSGNCGNMSSAVGPFALDEGLVRGGGNEACVRIHNTNTKKIIVSRFPIEEGMAAVDGDFVLPGVAGSGAPIRLEFTDPGGAGTGKLLPSGQAVDVLEVPGLGSIEASLIDAANPCVFVAASALGATGLEMPDQVEADAGLLAKLEAIRRAASMRMGLAATAEAAGKITGIPKIAMVAAPATARTLSRETVGADAMDIAVRMISVGQPHRAVPLTGAMCLAVATRIEGSIPHRLARPPKSAADDIRIAQPSGLTVVAATVRRNGGWVADNAVVYRTARRLMEGVVYYRAR
ncbi:MAG TPA: PrpF domain-containing protein [Candidatus Sulfotelmatobacter sp.]|nr:PrpF domain-containing protein [Candidatus Sulfotelmatobacter sp.]